MTFKTLVEEKREEERKLRVKTLAKEERKLQDVAKRFEYINTRKGVKNNIPLERGKMHGIGSIFFGSNSYIIEHRGEWEKGDKMNDEFTLRDGSTCKVTWQNGEKIGATFTKDGDEFLITDVGDTITVQHGPHILYIEDISCRHIYPIGEKRYRFGQMDKKGELHGIVKEVTDSNRECIYFYQDGKPKGDRIYNNFGNLTNGWELIHGILATYSQDRKKATLHYENGSTVEVKLLENGDIDTRDPIIKRNDDGTKTRYVLDKYGEMLKKIEISKDGQTGTLYHKDATFKVKISKNGDIDTKDPVTMDGLDGDKWLVKLSKDGDILETSERITRSDDGSGQWLVTLSEDVNTSEVLKKITRSEDGKEGTVIDKNGNELRFKLLDGKIDTESQAIITPENSDNPEFPDSYISYIRFHRVVSTTPERRPDPTIEEGPLEPSREEEVVSKNCTHLLDHYFLKSRRLFSLNSV